MIQFLLNQTLRTEHALDPNLTVLNYLREHLHKPEPRKAAPVATAAPARWSWAKSRPTRRASNACAIAASMPA